MNADIPQARWNQVSSQIKTWWGKIDDDDLNAIAGNAERLASVLQLKYGYTQQNAEAQSISWMRRHRNEPGIEP